MLLGANTQLSEFDEKSKMIANHLCRAAGVFEHIRYNIFFNTEVIFYIREQQLSQWKVKPDVPLPEAMDETYIALSE